MDTALIKKRVKRAKDFGPARLPPTEDSKRSSTHGLHHHRLSLTPFYSQSFLHVLYDSLKVLCVGLSDYLQAFEWLHCRNFSIRYSRLARTFVPNWFQEQL